MKTNDEYEQLGRKAEKYLLWAMEQRKRELYHDPCTLSAVGYDFLKGRHDECETICGQLGIENIIKP